MFRRILSIAIPRKLPQLRLRRELVPLVLFAYACLLPRELSIDVAGALLFPYRLVLIGFAPLAVRQLIRARVRPAFADLFAAAASVWFLIALSNTGTLEAGLVPGVAYGLDFGLAYLLGRASIRSASDLRTVFAALIPGLAVIGLILAVESIGHRILLRPLVARLVGAPDPELYSLERYGLLRAIGPFPHPILGGVFLVSLLPLAWFLAHNARQRIVGVLGTLMAVFTVSATTFVGLIIGVALITCEIAQRLTRQPVFLFLAFATAVMSVTISVTSESGLISFLSRRLTLDPVSGSYRRMIWEFGSAEAFRHPWFGIGQRDWTRPVGMVSDSVDSYWLFLMMFYGLPAMVFALLVMVLAFLGVVLTQKFRNADDRRAGAGIAFFLIIVMVSGLSVHFWESLHSWIIMLCGAGVSLGTQAQKLSRTAVPSRPPSRTTT